jgi:hypothetical protein
MLECVKLKANNLIARLCSLVCRESHGHASCVGASRARRSHAHGTCGRADARARCGPCVGDEYR